jgi:CRP-like cAMP-binding protein
MPYGAQPPVRAFEQSKPNRFLTALPPDDQCLLKPHLRPVALERGAVLHDVGDEIEHVYFPHSGMISLVAVMQSGATVETATVGRGGVVGAMTAFGSRSAAGRAVVQLPGAALRIGVSQFRAVARESDGLRGLVVRYNDLLISQIQQSVACNALHGLEARLCRWLLQTHDCVEDDIIPLTQEFLAQMLGVRRTTVTIAARVLQSGGLIRYRRGLIQIVNREGLEQAACECYATVRQNVEKAFGSSRSPLADPAAGDRVVR